jgi:hypothetical protein
MNFDQGRRLYTFGRESRYDSGISISAKALLLMAMAAFRI